MPPPLPVTQLFAGPPISVACAAGANALLILPPILAQIQILIFGAFGLGPLKLELVAQFKAAIGITIAFGNPLLALKLAITASVQVIAALKASLLIGIPPISIQVSASFALIASLTIKIGGINLAIDLALKVKLPAINLIADLKLALSLGNCGLYYWYDQTPAQFQGQIAAFGFPNPPAALTSGVMIVAQAPALAAQTSFKILFNPGL